MVLNRDNMTCSQRLLTAIIIIAIYLCSLSVLPDRLTIFLKREGMIRRTNLLLQQAITLIKQPGKHSLLRTFLPLLNLPAHLRMRKPVSIV